MKDWRLQCLYRNIPVPSLGRSSERRISLKKWLNFRGPAVYNVGHITHNWHHQQQLTEFDNGNKVPTLDDIIRTADEDVKCKRFNNIDNLLFSRVCIEST